VRRLALLIILLAIAIPCCAETLTVNPDGSAQYSNLTEALQQAQPEDTILLEPGLYRGNLNRDLYHFNGTVTIESAQGPQTCIMDCESSGRFLYASVSLGDTVTLKGLTIINARGGSGNIYVSGGGSLTLDNCIVRDCVSTSSGGVIYSSYGDQITLKRSLFLNNSSESRGGVLNVYNTVITIDHCIFAGNTCGRTGAVLYVDSYDEGKTVSITNSTFSKNTPDDEGAILDGYFSDDVSFKNCIIADNQNIAVRMYRYSDDLNLIFNSCLFSDNSGGLYYDRRMGTTYSTTASLNGLPGSAANISGQPHFAEENDFHLLANSAAIDSGLATPEETTDLDGLPRQIDGDQNRSVVQDIGPYEYDPSYPLLVVSQPGQVFIRDVNAPNPESQTLAFRNTTPAPSDWQLTSDSAWLEVSQNSGELVNDKTSVSVSVTTEGMSRGVYSAMLTLSDPNAVNTPVQIPVTLKIRGKLSVPGQFATLLEAVSDAMHGEIIEVNGGEYTEGIVLDKSLTLIGRNDPNIVSYYSSGIQITSDNCLVQGFHISGTNYGLRISGSHNTVKNLSISNTNTGVYLSNGSDNTLDQISISNSSGTGVNIQYSPKNTLTHITIENAPRGFSLTGNDPEEYQQNIDETNTVNGKPILYLVGESDRVIAPNLVTPACVYLVDCTDIVLFRLTLSGNGRGVCLVNSSNNTLRSVAISDCDAGVWLFDAPNNTLMKNTISDCDYGLRLVNSAQTTMRTNTFTDNVSSFSIVAQEENYEQTIDTSNLIDDLPIYYLVGENAVTLDDTTPAACIYAIECRDLTITNQLITNNTFGIALINCTNVRVEDVTCRNNQDSNLLIQSCTNVTIYHGLFTNSNSGINVTDGTNVEIRNCECSFNAVGMAISYSDFVLLNCVIHRNDEQGGIRHYASSNKKGFIQGCTIVNNSYGNSSYMGNGGAITGSANYLNILDSILWGNSPGTIPDPDYYDYNLTYCCVQDELTGTGNMVLDPLLTSDGHLTLDSPCIDAATPGRRRVDGVDMDGEPRRSGFNIDMGADEYVDTDSDGLPNWFEKEVDPNGLAMNPGDDLDGDDFTNLEEYVRFSGGALMPSGSYYVDPVNGDDLNLGNDPNQPKMSLQSALDIVGPGERILLMPGHYEESFTFRTQGALIQSLNPNDPDVVASTIIGARVQINNQGAHTTFLGLTFSTQASESINCSSTTVAFTHCRFVENTGAPLWVESTTLHLKHCEFTRNGGLLGGVFLYGSQLFMENCLIADNYNNGYAQALMLWPESKAILTHCTIANNSSEVVNPELASYYDIDYVPAILLYGGELIIANSIVWDSEPVFFDLQEEGITSQIWVTYSNLSDTADTTDPNWLGLGNISVDPGFAQVGYQPDNNTQAYVPGDYHLLSEEGRWDPTQATWVQDTTTSVGIGTANPAWPAQDPNWDGIRLNLGAYGNTPEQSLAPNHWSLLSDLTNDGIVEALDQTALTQLQSNPQTQTAFLNTHPADLNQDGDVDTDDLELLQSQMGQTTPWHIEGVLNDRWADPAVTTQPDTPGSDTSTEGGRR